MSITTTLSAREGRRCYRKFVAAFLDSVCPCCDQPILAHRERDVDACMARVSYWPVATLTEIADGQRKGRAA